MTRVAFTLIGGKTWTGGFNYLRNLLQVLAQHEGRRLTPVLFVGASMTGTDIEALAAIPGVEFVRTPLLDASRRGRSLLQAIAWGKDMAVAELFRHHRIDAVFENAQFFGWRLGLPAIAWIPDFQHRELPHMFTWQGRWKREIGFIAQVIGRRFVMLSSEDARVACERYYPSTRSRTQVVHFAVPPGAAMEQDAARRIANEYALPERFFFMPNQFWKHKNHALVVEALAILRERGERVVVAASGMQSDPRDPEHFPCLQAQVERLGVQGEMRFLGLIPYPHLAALMQSCTALLNPSLFEGWSTTVEEARAIGTPMLLSDLAVHREQMGADASYFDRYSALALADAMQGFPVLSAPQRVAAASLARQQAEARVCRFGSEFADLVEAIVRART
ncbi:glycosyltransferase family 1 protein [Ferriphaselus sp. R-1]|uniref:glycosyltransferase family 4 protein n=1 Tax=Ferriphaselus sp. R-1 TaxID=1485544 RepID=UPI0005575492|nr:glycosyltransferase family 1 protein [Ferriphaselus sp. R-1]